MNIAVLDIETTMVSEHTGPAEPKTPKTREDVPF